jgi:hypothetical protein
MAMGTARRFCKGPSMAKHPRPKAKKKASSPPPKGQSPSPETVTRAVVEAVVDQVAAAFAPESRRDA